MNAPYLGKLMLAEQAILNYIDDLEAIDPERLDAAVKKAISEVNFEAEEEKHAD